MDKNRYLKNVIETCITESIEEYRNFDGSFEDFKKAYPIHYRSDRGKGIGGRVYIYAITSSGNVKGIFENGQDNEFSGTGEGTNWYGAAFYGTWDYETAYKNLKNGKGGSYANTDAGPGKPAIIKYVLKDGFKNFIVFDADLRAQYGITESPSEQILKIMGQENYNSYDNDLRHSDYINSTDQQLGIKFIDKPASFLRQYRGGRKPCGHNGFNPTKNMWGFFSGNTLGDNTKMCEEFALKCSGVRGFAFDGAQDPHTVVVKNYKDVMPIGVVIDPKVENEADVKWDTSYATEENFNRINSMEDINWRYGGKYRKTKFDTKATFDYAIVKDDYGYNYVSLKDDSEVLPVPAEEAYPFGPDRKATFVIDGKEHKAVITPNGDIRFFYSGSNIPLKKEMFARKVVMDKNNR